MPSSARKHPLGDSLEERLVVAHRYLPAAEAAIQSVVSNWRPSTGYEDGQQGIDLVMLPSAGGTAAFRLRRWELYEPYRDQFTLRVAPHDERAKLNADLYLYGWASPYYQRAELAAWVLMDARAMLRAISTTPPVRSKTQNADGTAFVAYRFHPSFVLGRHDPPPAGLPERPALLHTCTYCGEPLPADELSTEPRGELVYYRHRSPCWSAEVP